MKCWPSDTKIGDGPTTACHGWLDRAANLLTTAAVRAARDCAVYSLDDWITPTGPAGAVDIGPEPAGPASPSEDASLPFPTAFRD